MSVGLPVTKNELDTRMGNISKVFCINFKDALTIKEYLDATADPDLVALGYTSNEIATMKTAFSDLAQLNGIWEGDAALAAPKDFTTFVSRLWGIGL